MQRRVLLIMCAGKVSSSLFSEIGGVRNSLIPYNGRPLFYSIIEKFQDTCEIFLALHKSDETGKNFARFKNCNIICVDGDQSLRSGVLEAMLQIQVILEEQYSLYLIFGDTIADFTENIDFIGVVKPQIDFSDWTTISITDVGLKFETPGIEGDKTVAGLFNFSNPTLFSKFLTNLDFFEAVRAYFASVMTINECFFELEGWLDFGRRNTFYSSRRSQLNTRTFNSVQYSDSNKSVVKSSYILDKIKSEIAWYKYIRLKGLEHLAPRLLAESEANGYYEIEFVSEPTVGEMFLFGDTSTGYWERFFESLLCFMRSYYFPTQHVSEDVRAQMEQSIRDQYLTRLNERITLLRLQSSSFFEYSFKSSTGSILLTELVTKIELWIKSYSPILAKIIHGDLFFGNLFFDDRMGKLLAIDPRGIETNSLAYDFEYEFAKLSHSSLGGYDFLASDLFDLKETPLGFEAIIPWDDRTLKCRGIAMKNIRRIRNQLGIANPWDRKLEAFLFLTMAPVHSESFTRQLACLCNAVDIFDSASQ